jgi:ABC-type antimicrobial peptide transport system permease subunit
MAVQDYFPRRVVVTWGDVGQLLVVMGVVAVLAGVVAVRRAMKVEARAVLD